MNTSGCTEARIAGAKGNVDAAKKFSMVWSARFAHGLPKASFVSERGPNVARSPPFFPLCGKIVKKFSIVWKISQCKDLPLFQNGPCIIKHSPIGCGREGRWILKTNEAGSKAMRYFMECGGGGREFPCGRCGGRGRRVRWLRWSRGRFEGKSSGRGRGWRGCRRRREWCRG